MPLLLNSFFLLTFFQLAYGFRALMFATNAFYSHMQFTDQLADILIDAGHEVDLLLKVWHRSAKSQGTQKANVIRFEGKNVAKIEELLNNMVFFGDAFEGDWSADQLIEIGKMEKLSCENILTDYKLLSHLRSRNYTVGLAENFDSCAWAVFRLLNIKSVHEMNALPLMDNSYFVHGGIFDFRRIPAVTNSNQVGSTKNIFELLYNVYQHFISRYYVASGQFGPTNQLFKDLIDPNHPTLLEMQKNSAYVWINTHEISDFARANSPKVKHLGGIAVDKKVPKLNEETAKIFEKAQKGVVLVSFGSLVNTDNMKEELRDEILQAFSQFPDYEFIWRLTTVDANITAIFNQYPNIHAFKWLQQSAILDHPKTRGFISHMGLNSYNEAVYFGIPLLSVPFFGDQIINTANALKQGMAVYLNRREITASTLSNALRELLYNDKYKERALNLKAKIAHSPVNQTELFIKYVEYAEKFGAMEELRLDTAGGSLVELFHLDLIGLALLFLFVSYQLTLFVLRRIFKLIKLINNQIIRVSRRKKVD